jgi:hypothetical protein
VRYVLAIIPVLAIWPSGQAMAGNVRLAQSQVSATCMTNCNNQYQTCANQCSASGTVSQIQPDINAGQVIQQNRIDILQNTQRFSAA